MNPRTYATTAHAGQTYGAESYTVHLEAVAAIVRAVDPSEHAEAVAWLHDVVEDTGATLIEIYHAFGPRVATAVGIVTDPSGYPDRHACKTALHERLSKLRPDLGQAERLALLVKAADRLANVRACVESGDRRLLMYRREHPAFRDAAHRSGLCDGIWSELDSLLECVS